MTSYLNVDNNLFMRQRAYVEIWNTLEIGEHERGVKVARGAAKSNSNIFSALQTFQTHYLDIHTAEALANCFKTLSKRSIQQLT